MNYSWLLYCAVSTVYINALLTNICFEELKLLHRLIIFSCCTLFSFVLPQLIGTWGNIISFTFIFLFIVYLQKHPFLNAIGMLLNYIIGVTLNYLLLMFLYLVGVNPVSLYENIPYYFMFNIFQLCIMHPLTHAAGNFYRNLIHLNIIPFYTHKHNQKVLRLIAIELILCGLIFIFNVTLGNLIGYSYSVILFNGILFSLFFLSTGVLIFCLYKTIQENYEFQARVAHADSLSEYACRLEHLYKEIRCFKHDYMNILSSMYAYLDEQRFDELKQYFEKTLLPDGRKLAAEDDLIGRLKNIEIMELKGLLYTKILSAGDFHLRVTVDIPEKIAEINMKVPDLMRILGIFLDNAIDAASQTCTKELYIGILRHDNVDYLHITNSASSIPNLAELFKEGYSSKSGHAGVGLYEVETLLKKYPESLLNTEYNAGRFTQILQIKKS